MKYARDEIERRWLGVRESLPDLSDLDCWTIEDLYLDGTRMRLRRMTRGSTGERLYKLCKKYGKTGAITEPITNIYLDEAEHAIFRSLPGTSLTRRRHYSRYEGVGFGITTREGSDIVIVEAEYPSEDQARGSPVPPYCGREVSDDRQFEGFALSS